MTTFETLGLPAALNAALARMNYTAATPVQAQAIPPALQGRDVLGTAQTGTGKTAAFCIPLVNHLMNDPKAVALVMTPTRELATQVTTVAQQLAGREHNIRTALLIGGDSMVKQFKQLNNRPRLIIGTPGRINDHLRRNRDMLEFASFLVLDEADRMLDMGFTVQIDEVLRYLPAQRQTLMFSATMPHKIAEFSKRYMKEPVRVAVASQQASADNITHAVIRTTAEEKYGELVKEIVARDGSIIVFVKTKRGADRMATRLQKDSYDAEAIHGDLKQSRRDRVIREFRDKKHRILVATDVAARGLDVPHVEHVINYDLPQVAEDYIHRIGRTARAGAKGHALCILTSADGGQWAAIDRILNPGQPGERQYNRSGHDRPARNGKKPRRSGQWKKFRNREDGSHRKDDSRPYQGRKHGGHDAGRRPQRDGEGYRPERKQEARPQDGRPDRGYNNDRAAASARPDREDNRPRRSEGFRPHEGRKTQNAPKRDGNRTDRSEGFRARGERNGNSQQQPRRDDQGFQPPRRRDGGQPEKRQDGYRPHGERRPHNGGFKKSGGKPFRHKHGQRKHNHNRDAA